MNEFDALLDQALDSYPISPTPPGFSKRVMGSILPGRMPGLRPAPQPSFRLDFLDFAIPGFLALCASFLLSGGMLALALINPELLRRIEIVLEMSLNRLPAPYTLTLLVCSVLGMLAVFLALLAAGLGYAFMQGAHGVRMSSNR